MPERKSVGECFFLSMANNSLLKRMKARLNEAAEFHHQRAAEAGPLAQTDQDTAGDDTMF